MGWRGWTPSISIFPTDIRSQCKQRACYETRLMTSPARAPTPSGHPSLLPSHGLDAETRAEPARSRPQQGGCEGGAAPISLDLLSQCRYIGHPSNPWCDDSPTAPLCHSLIKNLSH